MIYLSWAIWFKRTSLLTGWTALGCAGHKQEVCHFGNERDYRQVSWTLYSCQSQAWMDKADFQLYTAAGNFMSVHQTRLTKVSIQFQLLINIAKI